MSKPLKEDYIIRIKSRIEQHVKEPVEQEEKEEFVELMTRGQFVQKGGSYYITYKETETTGYEGCTTTLKTCRRRQPRGDAAVSARAGGAGTQLLIEKRQAQPLPLRDRLRLHDAGCDRRRDRVRPDREGRHREVSATCWMPTAPSL